MLFCKPTLKADVLYEHPLDQVQTVKFRSLALKKDLNILQSWISQARSKFEQPEMPVQQIYPAYQAILKNPDCHSFIGILDEQLICLVEVCRLQNSELGNHIECKYHDCSVRLLMPPTHSAKPDLSFAMMIQFMRYLFTFEDARYIYAEPDIHNTEACRLFEKCGFSFLQNIMLDTKAASLYLMTRNQFRALHKVT